MSDTSETGDHPMTVDEFNDATMGFYELLHDGIANELAAMHHTMRRQHQEMKELLETMMTMLPG